MPKADQMDDVLVIDDVATLKALADPVRMRLVGEMLDRPHTVKEMAAALGVPQTRLYYHVKILEKHGLIRVVSRRTVSGIEERTYQSTARSQTVSPALGAEVAKTGVARALFDMVVAQLEIALEDPSPIGDPKGSVPLLTLTKQFLSEEEIAEVQRRFESVMVDYEPPAGEEPPTGKREYHLFFTGYHLEGRRREPDSSAS
jgi:DNA-binding transcriptional ArsR family regulator